MKKCFKNTLFKILQKYGKNTANLWQKYGKNMPNYGRNKVKIQQFMAEIW